MTTPTTSCKEVKVHAIAYFSSLFACLVDIWFIPALVPEKCHEEHVMLLQLQQKGGLS